MGKSTASSFKNYWAYSWWKYLLALAVPSFVWPYAFYLKDKPKDNEELQVFVASDKISDYTPLTTARDALVKQGIVTLNAYVSPASGTSYNAALDLQGIASSDLLIIPSDSTNFSTYVSAGDFVTLDSALWAKIPSGYEAYSDADGNRIGVKVYQAGNETYNTYSGFASWIDWSGATTDYCLFINAKMPNIGSYNTKSGSHEETLWLFEYLLNYGKA